MADIRANRNRHDEVHRLRVEKISKYPFGLFQPGLIHHYGSPAFLGHKQPIIGTVLIFPEKKRDGLFSQGIGK